MDAILESKHSSRYSDPINPVEVVLAKKGEGYSTHLRVTKTGEQFWGHYFDTLEAAVEDYGRRN